MMKKLLSVLLAVGLLLCLGLSAVSAEAGKMVDLSAEEQQAVFDAWFAFLYEDYFIPANKYYDSYEEFAADQGEKLALEKLSTENVAIECWYKENDVYIVTVEHDLISYIDLAWRELIGGYYFNFSGVHQALWVCQDGQLYSFKEAYDAGLVSQNALSELALIYPRMFRAGDMDEDGTLAVSDVVALRTVILEGGDYQICGDLDGDEENTVSDVVALRTVILSEG